MDLPAPTALHQSATFEERGVSVPFTTPALAGARVRRDERHGLVLIVPNPAGGRGVYVLSWSGIHDMCQPTLHDTMLHGQISTCGGKPISPGTVRAAARKVAIDGAAGRPAYSAAVKAMRADLESCQATKRFLLDALAAQTAVQADATEITALASMADEIGVGPNAERASIALRLAQLKTLHAGLSAMSQTGLDETGYASTTLGMAALAIRCADKVLATARAQLADIAGLLAGFRLRAADIASVVGRPAWVLDGWELPGLLWSAASGVSAQCAALVEIGQALAMLPREAEHWLDAPVELEVSQCVRRTVSTNQDWRTGFSTLDVVARNEHFRAMSA